MFRMPKMIICGFVVLSLCGCSESNKDTNDELTNLQQRYSILENENIELKAAVDKLNAQIDDLHKIFEEKPIQMSRVWGVSYIGIPEDEVVRFIDNETELKALPFDDAPTIRTIEPNTLVKVNMKASNGYYDDLDTVWYQVWIPVYDTPSDCYGWVKYNQTNKYTSENQKLLKNPISVRIGAVCSESYNGHPDFDNEYTLRVIEDNQSGAIIDEQGDYVNVFFAGGQMLWVSKEDLVYPEIP